MPEQRITIRELNTKRRKGLYLEFAEKGKRTRFLKYDPDIPIDVYVLYILDRDKGKRVALRTYLATYDKEKKIVADKRTRKRIETYQRSKSRIAEILIRGAPKTVVVENIYSLTEGRMRELLIGLMQNYTRDKRYTDILTLEENLRKIATHFEFKANLIDAAGNEVGSLVKISTSTPRMITQELTDLIPKGTRLYGTAQDGTIGKLMKAGYTYYEQRRNVPIERIDLAITYRP